MHLLQLSWAGERVFKAWIGAHHDAELLDDGRILTLTRRRRRMVEIHAQAPVLDEAITIVSPTGQVLEELWLAELLRTEGRVDLRFPRPSVDEDGPGIDLIHANSIEWIDRPDLVGEAPLYAPGNVLFCSQAQDLIGVVDLAAAELVWVWGQEELSGPHHPSLLETGNVLVFDNGLDDERSRVIELDPRTGEIVWLYQAPEPGDFFTRSRGSAQRLPNGNTLIANSDEGVAFEVTPEGEIVWEFRTPHLDASGHRATIVRMTRYPSPLVEALLRKHAAK
jgi:hypothetical protein